ncbi:alpha/beta fold hydrolase [Roseomonas haemaphysalidis]|uniref:Alpha/beta hydrolase n=1 Tax=Roseomonas haemaphysalidis TaxID=2768162 RepID=A0ABS3KKS7_9PROT|nr:alpha/beta hydrolase [Roseomonas haemaphysalidis]MBO1078074.1 alpha/beta hydrolase [Roseomonas haemaphysalidis]
MTPDTQFARRSLVLGATAALAGGLARPFAAQPGPPQRPSGPGGSFQARSADGTVLTGDALGDPAAPEILFIHGLRQSRLSWERQFADPALSGFRLVRFDLRGHGDSDKPATPSAYADADRWAEDVAAVIAAAGLRRPVLVGWSLGGYVAGAYLRQQGAGRVSGVNLVDAVSKLSPDLLTPLAGRFARSTSSHDLTERVAETADFLAACFHRPPTGADLHRMLVVNGMTARAVNEGFTSAAVTDFEPTFQAYSGPVLVTHGAHDALVRLAMSERVAAQRPGRRLSVFPQSGHTPFWEEPERYGQELAAFVTAIAKG